MDFEYDNVELSKPYCIANFAKKHGLTYKVAELILLANAKGSRAACDAAALAFLTAVAIHSKRQSTR